MIFVKIINEQNYEKMLPSHLMCVRIQLPFVTASYIKYALLCRTIKRRKQINNETIIIITITIKFERENIFLDSITYINLSYGEYLFSFDDQKKKKKNDH